MAIEGIYLTIVGIAAGILILTGWVWQIYKGYNSKSLKDVSKFLMIFISAGAVLWLAYGVSVQDIFIIGTNLAAIILMMLVLGMKIKYSTMQSVK
ncbi:MAG: hypothetical protein D9C04_01000 [Nitrosopumilus sp. B06]|nr:MAG: hypothetical protein EB828_05175 [Nitrosopumilus sp. D6]RNJ80543.1 MAG: hypothetical protein D9C04_01000 [Nitrosopumilus sp. B06]